MSSNRNNEENEDTESDAVVLMDRFVSASSPNDAIDSLQAILAGLKSGKWQQDWIFEHAELLESLLQLLQHGTISDNIECGDEGVPLVCQVFLQLKDHQLVLQKPKPGRLLEALLDVMEPGSEGRSAYTRVLALQVLEGISKGPMNMSKAGKQWLEAPNGLHRLADLIDINNDNPAEEVVRNQALLVLRLLAKQAPMAKVFLFGELDVKLLDFCWHIGGGLTKGSTIVQDALELILELYQHTDASLQDLVWQRPTVAPRLTQLLDLRGGDEFLHPKPKSPKKNVPPLSSSKQQDADDLDDLLNSGSTSRSEKSKENKTTKDDGNQQQQQEDIVIPRLLPSEEKVVMLTLRILEQLLDTEGVRTTVWKQHIGLCAMVWELALMGPPPPKPFLARPSPQLQQAALEVVATRFNDSTLMDRFNGLDRLMLLVVTGGRTIGSSKENQDSKSALGISQAALAVLRNTLDAQRIHELLLFTLAPPPPMDDDDDPAQKPPPGPTEVHKLWNTVAENLVVQTPSDNDDDQSKPVETAAAASDNNNTRSLFLSGALGGLALMLKDEESREMMFKIMTVSMDQFLETLETEKDEMVQWTLLRFLCEWIFQSPFLVQSLLSSTMSTHLASMASGKSTNPLLYLLLGLALDSMISGTAATTKVDNETDAQNYGGWSRDGIFQVLQSVGISKVTSRLESLTKKTTDFPWSECSLEYKHWQNWYQKAVRIVRKRMLEEFSRSSGGDDDDSDDEGAGEGTTGSAELSATPSKTALLGAQSSDLSSSTPSAPAQAGANKTLHKLLNQQSKEMDELRQELEEAKSKILVQESQLETWKRRVESTPTELDTMLNEFTAKTTDLEETIRKMQKEANQASENHEAELKRKDDILAEQRQEAERLRSDEQDARDDRDRMEQELQGLSQAYASLEQEFRQHQSAAEAAAASSSSGAPTGETDGINQGPSTQSQGEDSQQVASTTTTGSTEVATLREEINRLRGENERQRTNAREADNWMQMAVERMNEMGATNANLQSQVSTLEGQIQIQQQAQQTASSSGEQAERIAATESQLQHETSLRQGAEAELANVTGEIEMQKQQIEQLQTQLSIVHEELRMTTEKAQADTAELRQQLEESRHLQQQYQQQDQPIADQSELQQLTILQQQLFDVQERSKATIEEKQAQILDLQQQLEVAQQQPQQLQHQGTTPSEDTSGGDAKDNHETILQLQNTIDSKDAEIQSLQYSLEQKKSIEKSADAQTTTEGISSSHASSAPPTATSEHFQQQLEVAKQEAEEINRRSQEEIYKKEARIRELEDRINSGLGGYNVEDIRQRDEEIEELRTANEAAQDWMAKAVEHHQLLTNQVRAMTEEKAKLESQLNNSVGGPVNSNANEAALKLLEGQLQEKTAEVEDMKSKLAGQEEELTSLRSASSGLEQDLGISRDDLGNLQRQYEKSEETVKALEARLAENALSAENDNLRESNEDLKKRLEEFQAWADVAQTKIAEILAAKENAEKLLGEANEKLNSKDQELQKPLETEQTENSRVDPATETLATIDHVGDGDIAELQLKLAEMETINKMLSDDCETQKTQLTELQGHYSELQAWAETAQQKIAELSSANVQNENTSNVGEDEHNKELGTLESTSTPDNDQGDEIETHKKQYAELESAYKELQAWTETAQQRISELLESQKDSESSLAAAKEEAETGRNEIEGLKQRIDSNQSGASNDVPSQQDVAPESGNVAEGFFGSDSKATQNRNAEDFFGSEKATTSDAGDFFGPSSAGGPAEGHNDGGNIVDFLRKQLRQKEEDLKTLQEKLSEGEERRWEDRVAELESEVDSLQKQMAEQEEEANDAINQWQESFADAEKKCEELETKLESSQKDGADGESSGRVAELKNKVELLQKQIAEQQSDDESVVRKWEDRVTELENEINSLQEQIAENEEEANNAINQWQESFSDAEKRCEELEARLEATQKENESLKGSLGTSENVREGIESSTQDLDRKIASLEDAIDAEMDELHQTETESTKDDDEAVEGLKEKLKQATEELDRDENVVTQWEDRVAELGATVEELQKQLQEQEDEANGVISQWQDSYNDAESRCTELEKELESIKGRIERDAANSISDGVTETNHADTQDQELMAKIDNLELELTQARDALSGDEDVVNKWEERAAELESLVKSLETQLEEQERDSNEAIAKWEDAAVSTDEAARGLEEKVSALLEENSALQSSISEMENEKSVLKEQAADLQNRLSGVENVTSDHDELTARLAKSEQDLVETKASLSHAEDIAQQWEEQCTSLESQIQTLENQLNEQEEEAKNVLQQWQDSYTELEERLVSLEGSTQSDDSTLALEELRFQVESKNDELNVARKRIEADAEVVKQWEDRVTELETDVEGLRSRLNEQEKEAETAITVLHEKNSELQELCTDLESRLATREEELADKVSTIESLTSQLEDRVLNSDDAMQQLLNTKNELEASVKEYSSENARLCTDIESEKEARRADRERLEAELADERGRHAEARDEIEELSKSIEQIRNESDDVVNQWTERVDELTSAFQDLEVQLAEQEKDANEAISSWEEKANDLESDLESFSELMRGVKAVLDVEEDSMISTALDNVIKARDSALQERESATKLLQAEIEKTESLKAQATGLNEQLSTVNKRCEEYVAANEELKKSKEERIAAMSRSEVTLKNELSELQKELEYVKEDRSRMKETLVSKSREKLEEERNRLAVVIAQLEEEVREANEMIQAYVTDASSKQATELAAQGLREEIEHIRCQMDEYRATAENEKAAREASELETERLRDDISSLIALGDDGLGSGDLEVLTARASEKIKAKERQEIDQIRKSLYRAIDELELARATEKEANEKLSKARLQNSVCEQEIVAAKSEILFLTQTLEDMRLAEEGKRASLEYHIGSLEDEIDVLRKYNADELQNVRNELSQVSMEKDRILSQLKDTEKTNEALLLTTQREFGNNNETANDIDDLEAEVAKLRVENEYLLTVAANDKARAERRLREMLGAHGAASEADTILEHELRIAAEATIKTLKIEIEELKEARDKDEERNNVKASFNPNSPSPMRIKGKDDIHTNDDTESLKKEIQKLKKENSSLKSKMEKEASKLREKIESITEECRQAQAKSHKLQRQGRFDAAVKSEIAMTRMSPGMSTPPRGRGTTEQDENWMLLHHDHAAVDSPAPGGIMTSAEGFDLIRRQKEEIQEERQMYLEFLEEHEDLLALLAQNDVERACLKRLIADRLGEDAVDQAIREAEEKSRTKFGQTIRVS